MTSSLFSSTTFKVRSPLHTGQARISIRSFFTKIHHQSHFCDRGGDRVLLFAGIVKCFVLYFLLLIFIIPDMKNLSLYLHLIRVYPPEPFTYIFADFMFAHRSHSLYLTFRIPVILYSDSDFLFLTSGIICRTGFSYLYPLISVIL